MNKHKRLISGLLIAALVLSVPLLYLKYRLDLRPVGTGLAVEFQVKPGESAPQVARRLYESQLIRDRTAFVTYVNIHGLRPRLKTGIYLISPASSGQQIAQLIAGGKTLSKRLIVPEGYRLAQIRDRAQAELGITAADFNAALSAPRSQPFLAGKPAKVSLEGYLFPDSYELGASTTAESLVSAMLANFERRVGPEYTQAFAAQGLTLHQGLTLASLVEKEVSIPTDRPVVAQIFLKRIKESMPLGSDVTTHYAADLLGAPFNVNLDSPYNTRRYSGFPPGPICNPGLSSLDAVAHPAKTNYLYFLSGKDGKTYYGTTYPEHQRNIDRYLN